MSSSLKAVLSPCFSAVSVRIVARFELMAGAYPEPSIQQPSGLERLLMRQVVVLADEAPILQRRHAGVGLRQRDTAALGAHRHVAEHHEPVAEVDELGGLDPNV